jgi:Na+-driven multidrug efflux pump
MKKVINWLSRWDVVWSAPLSFLAFIGFAYAMQILFGESFGSYDPAMYQAAIYAIGIMILFNGSTLIALWFNWRGLYRYYLHKSKQDFENLESWQKILFLFGLYLSLLSLHIFAWAMLV